jgi:hypothetical protein
MRNSVRSPTLEDKGIEGLEPYEGKLSRTVLRGLGSGNTPRLPDNCTSDRRAYGKLEDPPIKHEYCIVFKKTNDSSQSEGQPLSYDQLEIEEAIRALQTTGEKG